MKLSGINQRAYYRGIDFSNMVVSANSLNMSLTEIPSTTIDETNMSRLQGLADVETSFGFIWNTDLMDTFKNVRGTPSTISYHLGTGVGDPVFINDVIQTSFGYNRGEDGSLRGTTSFMGNGSIVGWGISLTDPTESLSTSALETSPPFDRGATAHVADVSGRVVVHVLESSQTQTFKLSLQHSAVQPGPYGEVQTSGDGTADGDISNTGIHKPGVYYMDFNKETVRRWIKLVIVAGTITGTVKLSAGYLETFSG